MDFFDMNEDWLKQVGQIYALVPENQPAGGAAPTQTQMQNHQVLPPNPNAAAAVAQAQVQLSQQQSAMIPRNPTQYHQEQQQRMTATTQTTQTPAQMRAMLPPTPFQRPATAVSRKMATGSNLTVTVQSRDLETEHLMNDNILSLQTSPTSFAPLSPKAADLNDVTGTTAYASKNMTPIEKQIVKMKRRIRNCEAAKRSRSKREARIKQMQVEHGQMKEEIVELKKMIEYFKSENQRIMTMSHQTPQQALWNGIKN